jgi:hypothetical protein
VHIKHIMKIILDDEIDSKSDFIQNRLMNVSFDKLLGLRNEDNYYYLRKRISLLVNVNIYVLDSN